MTISEYSLNWDSFKNNICDGFTNLQQQGEFVDMTLAADGHYVKVHRSLIALASPYLKEIIKSIPCPHPVVFLNNIGYDELCYALEYIYTGEVQIPTEKIKKFLKIASSLHIKGIQDTLTCETNMQETPGSSTQPTPPTQEKPVCPDQRPILNTKLVVSRKARPRGRPYKICPQSNKIAGKTSLDTEKELSNINTETNEEQQTKELVNSSPGLSEFLTINRAQYEVTQKDDTVSLSDFFITDDKDKESQQGNNVQSFLTHPFPISTKGKGIDSNADMESIQPISLDAISSDFFPKDPTSESSVSTKQLFPGKIIDYDNGKGKNMFQIEILSQEELVNGIRTKTDIYNDRMHTEAFNDIEMEIQKETPRENIELCPTLENFEDIIDQQQNVPTSQPTAQYNITLTAGEGISVQNVSINQTPAVSTAVEAQTNNLEKLTDADIKGSCCPLYTVSNRGSLQLIMNRFIYYCHHKARKDQSRRRWRCADYRPKGCKAFIDTVGESIVNRAGLHVHPFHDKQIINKTRQKKVFSTVAAIQAAAQINQNDSQSVVQFDDSEEDDTS